jgi:hypothetical protein
LVQLGSAGTLDEKEFVARCAMLSIRTCVPVALRAAATRFRGENRDALLEAANRCEAEPTLENARHALKAAADAAAASYAAVASYAAAAAANATVAPAARATVATAAAAADAADAAANATVAHAADAADAAANATVARAAVAAAAAADGAAAATASAAAFGAADADADKILSDFAEGVVQILIDMDVPGVQWLSLTESVTP